MPIGDEHRRTILAQAAVVRMVFEHIERASIVFDEGPFLALSSIARWGEGEDDPGEVSASTEAVQTELDTLQQTAGAPPALILGLSALRCVFALITDAIWADGDARPLPTVTLWWSAAALEALGEPGDAAEARVTLTWHRALHDPT